MRISIVDVFAEAKLEGNPLAVVTDAGDLDGATMQRIAREMNLSETTFVTGQSEGRAAVRIFTPNEELPFAGHPTLGTAWLLTRGERPITLELGVGNVDVWFDNGIAWMTPPPMKRVEPLDAEFAASLIGLEPNDLDSSLGACLVDCGLAYSFIGVADIRRLKQMTFGAAAQQAGVENAPFVVCRGGYSQDADFAARMFFFDGNAMREDPATGSANSAFAYYLAQRGEHGRFIVEQGFEIERPSRIYLVVGAEVKVGGRIQPVLEGRLI